MTRRPDARLEPTGSQAADPAPTRTTAGARHDAEEADPALHALAVAAGIQTSYMDGTDQMRTTPVATLRRILAALGLHAEDAATARRTLTGLRRARVRPGVPDVVVAWDDTATRLRVRVPPEERDVPLGLRILFEDGGERVWEHQPDPRRSVVLQAEGAWSVAYDVSLPSGLPYGYHTLEVRIGEDIHRAHLISAPHDAPRTRRHEWGLFVPTYALRRSDGFGVGDLTDLGRLADWMHTLGGSIIATLPLLDTFLSGPIVDPSPYAPVSRRFWSGLLVDPAAEPESHHPQVQAIRDEPAFVAELARLRAAPNVDHVAVWRLKSRLFAAMAEVLEAEETPRRRAFYAFLRHHPDVERYARFRAATERHGPWHTWPDAAQHGDLSVLEIDADLARMHAYVEWVADGQVARITSRSTDDAARTAGPDDRPDSLPMRLHLDLPLGAHPDGYDTWNDRLAYADGIETGAPPDGFFEKGQKWGFPPLNPRRLRQSGYRHFAACLRHHLRHAQLLRIDHVMSLHRLFWVPTDRDATDGAYVHYPQEELYAVVLLEAHRAGALVVGEDLGTVPPVVHEAMDRHHLHRTYVLQLQARKGEGSPPEPSTNSLATLNTHDMVPFAAWWRGDDITQRLDRGFLDEEGAAAAQARRERVKAQLLKRLPAAGPPGALPGTDGLPADTATARDRALRFLFASPAQLVVSNLEDLWLETDPQNQPGFGPDTPEGKKNWARRTRLTVEAITADATLADFLLRLSHTRTQTDGGDTP